ncbi:MAG: hypothetical protein IKP67_04450, partial [Spirochaetales bacterium]|nr:hypothetical protein [Spirochaetales bacterium]
MRKHLHKLLFNIIFVVIFCLTVGCPQEGGVNMFVGVGRNVDETPPVITVTSPIDGSYLGERDLTISGTASDNVGVTKVSIEMRDMSTGDTLISGTNCNSMTSGVWEVVFTYSELNKINLFSNADSKQVYFRITAYDAMMNEAFTSLLLRVDTDAPTATWSRPATSTRFKDAEHNTFVLNRAEFDMKYSMDKTDTIGYFHNGVEQFSGFVDDNSKAAQTYLRFYKSDAAGHSILAAVTPVIKGTVTDDNSNDVNIVGRAPELSDTASAVQEIGTPVVSASPASWKYDIDTNALSELDGDDGWYRVVIATRDGADNTCDQLDSPEWILINQDADMPRNKFNIRKGVSINVNGQVSGIAFDDDGVKSVYIAAVPDNSDDIKALTDKSPTEWMPDDCTSDVYTTETAVYARILAADTDNGAPTLNWSITVPITGIGYRLFAVSVDINDLSEDKYADAAFDGLYHTTFRVASIEDPVISLTTRIVDMTSDTAVIRGYFYDNKAVTKIEASMSSYMTLGGEVKSDVSVDIYNGTETAKFIITDTTIDTLSTGQKVTKYFFNWIFSPSVFVPDLGYSSMEILLKVYDDEGRYGNDTLNVYGDSERPMFDRMSPPNNSTITEDVTFDGWIYDNIGITELRLYCKGLTSQFAERKWGLGGVNDLSVDNESVLYDGTTDTLRGKYGRHFSTIITPSQIGYGTPLVVIEAKDKAGNTNEYQINIKGDTKSPEVAFPGMNSGL